MPLWTNLIVSQMCFFCWYQKFIFQFIALVKNIKIHIFENNEVEQFEQDYSWPNLTELGIRTLKSDM
jgi:hypothetical protein